MQALTDGLSDANSSLGPTTTASFQGGQYDFVVLSAGLGDGIAEEAMERNDVPALQEHCEEAESGPSAVKGLFPVNEVPVVEHWATMAEASEKTQPLEERFWVVTHNIHGQRFKEWAANHPQLGSLGSSHVLATGESGGGEANLARDLAAYTKHTGAMKGAIAVDGDFLLEPDYNFSRFVEHAHLRNRDCVMFTEAERGTLLPSCASLVLETPMASAPRVLGVHPGAEGKGQSNGQKKARVVKSVPVYSFRKETLEKLVHWVDEREQEGTMPPPEVALQEFVKSMVEEGEKVHALRGRYVTNVKTVASYDYTDRLHKFVEAEKAKSQRVVKPSKKDHVDLSMEADTADMVRRRFHPSNEEQARRLEETRRRTLSRCVDLDKLLPVFELRYQQAQSVTSAQGHSKPPPGFVDASRLRYPRTEQHPCYTTTNNVYGSQKPLQQELPMSWNGLDGRFTKGIMNSMYRDNGLDTSPTKSNVHRLFDEL